MIDLHVHSSASDGSFTPEKIAAQGRDFALMALTDHDSSEGVARMRAFVACIEPITKSTHEKDIARNTELIYRAKSALVKDAE